MTAPLNQAGGANGEQDQNNLVFLTNGSLTQNATMGDTRVVALLNRDFADRGCFTLLTLPQVLSRPEFVPTSSDPRSSASIGADSASGIHICALDRHSSFCSSRIAPTGRAPLEILVCDQGA